MPRFAVLLRGINVGKAKRVAMADLRDILGDLGYSDVKTHLNSGNAVVTGPKADPVKQAARIEEALAERTGVSAGCLVVEGEHLRAVVDGHPYADEMAAVEKGGSRMMAHLLLTAPPPKVLAAHDPAEADPGHAQIGDRVIYQWCPDGLMEAPDLHAWAAEHLGVQVTSRNWNTIAKLDELL